MCGLIFYRIGRVTESKAKSPSRGLSSLYNFDKLTPQMHMVEHSHRSECTNPMMCWIMQRDHTWFLNAKQMHVHRRRFYASSYNRMRPCCAWERCNYYIIAMETLIKHPRIYTCSKCCTSIFCSPHPHSVCVVGGVGGRDFWWHVMRFRNMNLVIYSWTWRIIFI